jgi:hypothetical protein
MATHRGFAVTTRTVENFWAKIDVRGEDECWPWIAGTDKLGYGRFKLGGKKGQAVETHRLAFTLANGFETPLHVLHSCNNRPCCNPKHLNEGTHAQNMADKVRCGSSRAPNSKVRVIVTDVMRQTLLTMRNAGANLSQIARELSISPGCARSHCKQLGVY